MSTVVLLSAGEAQRLTQRIKLTAGIVRDNLFKLRNLVEEAKASNVWQILGYPSWTAYLSDTLASEPMRLGREQRQELVEYLSGEGLSTRAIAPIVGASVGQVHADKVFRNEHVKPVSSEPALALSSDELEFDPTPDLEPRADDWVMEAPPVVNTTTGEIIDAPTIVTETHTVKTVIGLDGKEYKQNPRQAPRRPLIDEARSAGFKLREAVERLERLKTDDRFSRNKAEILAALQPHLDFANEVLQDL